MLPKEERVQCQICKATESKYTCSRCMVLYCSVDCFKRHKEESCTESKRPSEKTNSNDAPSSTAPSSSSSSSLPTKNDPEAIIPSNEPPLHPLTSLKWPYIPDQPAYPDPLKKYDPKVLTLDQYEKIATTQKIRHILSTHPRLKPLLTSINSLRGEDREEALQRALGVTTSSSNHNQLVREGELGIEGIGIVGEEEMKALRELAEAVESVVRGQDGNGALGLDWGD
ncbi:hypothetical protein ABKN59_007315 [Abortiporus biennis]